MPHRIACFVTPHGFGHAARASAIMAALLRLEPTLYFDIFTTVPQWFFDHTLAGHFDYHAYETDVGVVQTNSLTENLDETVRKLDDMLPFCPQCVGTLMIRLQQNQCDLVLCDIAPLGIAVAQAAGVPSVLIENFTWDWIYAGYVNKSPGLQKHISYLKKVFAAADYLIQTKPLCNPRTADVTIPPISRSTKMSRAEVRQVLGIPVGAKVVLLTMGGTHWDYAFLQQLQSQPETYFIIPGAVDGAMEIRDNLVLLPHSSPFFHPDMINASDAVVGKVGYSTLAEVYRAGIPYGYVTRAQFVESAVLVDFVERQMAGLPISPAEFQSGAWVAKVPQLLSLPKITRIDPNGANIAAKFVMDVLTKKL